MARIWCDFNGGIDDDTFGLTYIGSRRDIDEQGIELRPGLDITLYMEDELSDGRPAFLLVDAVVEVHPRYGLVARTKAGSWRHEPQ